MKTTVKIEGLDCPNCAKSLEKLLCDIDSVENASIDFINSKLTYESKQPKLALQKIVQITKQVEPSAKITEGKIGDKTKHRKQSFHLMIDISTLIIGIVFGVCALFLPIPTWAFWVLFVISALLLGYKTYYKALRLLLKGIINENLLITLSVIGATAIGESMEGLMVICLYSIGKIFEGLAIDKSRSSIEKLTNLQIEEVTVIDNGQEIKKSPNEVEIGSLMIVKAGERVALDGDIVAGACNIGMQSLTGESLPIFKESGQEILSGSVVLDGVLKIRTKKLYSDSTVSKIMDLIENASEKKSKTETLISKISKYYTLAVIALSIIVWVIVWAVTSDFNIALYRGLIFLVVSCPCAFAISVPLAYFSGLGNASKNGILIKGSNYLDACAKLNVVAFDKTGTLTTGKFEIKEIKSFSQDKSEEDVLYLVSLGEQNSLHPIAKSIVLHNKKKLVSVENIKEVAGEGIYYEYDNKKYFVGRKNKEIKNTLVELHENDVKIGEIYLSDRIKESAKWSCQELDNMKVKTIMLTGDNLEIAEKVGEEIGIKEVKAQLLPQDKFNFIENLKQDKQNIIGYVGDGLNDAPSLMLADVGISMGINGSPASIEASDVVLVDDNPNKIPVAIKISKFTRKIVWQNIILSALVKFTFLLLGALGITGMLFAVFADVGVTLIAILNSIRALKHKHK